MNCFDISTLTGLVNPFLQLKRSPLDFFPREFVPSIHRRFCRVHSFFSATHSFTFQVIVSLSAYPRSSLGAFAWETIPSFPCLRWLLLRVSTVPGPFSLKPQRLRQFRKRFGRRLGHESINGIKQGISCFQQTVIQVVTKLSHCVNVYHTSKLPLVFLLSELYSIWPPSARFGGLLSQIV